MYTRVVTLAGGRGLRRGTLLVSIGLYAAVLLASPSLHHDFQCHATSPRHCQACTANPPAHGAEPLGTFAASLLVDFGRTALPPPSFPPNVEARSLPGRSPPR